MRKLLIALAGVAALGVAAAAISSQAQSLPKHDKKVVGYEDEEGTFHALTHVDPDLAAASPITGKLVVNFKIHVVTALPSGTKIYCGADLIAISLNESAPTKSATYTEGASEVGSTTACTLTINYSWLMAARSATVVNTLTGAYTVAAINTSTPTLVGDSIGSRESAGALSGLGTVPATGTTTTLTVDVTL
jgi:hypothetical protein